MVDGWRQPHDASPYRVVCGGRCPARPCTDPGAWHPQSQSQGPARARGRPASIVTGERIVPNFSWTPRLAIAGDDLSCVLSCAPPSDLLLLPAVNGDVVRLFFDLGKWYIADQHVVEALLNDDNGPLSLSFLRCLLPHFKQGLRRFLADLRRDRVWFFALYLGEGVDLMYLGTCASVLHGALPTDPRQACPDFDFSLHRFLPPSVPILPDVHEVAPSLLTGTLFDLMALAWTQPYDGVLVMNPVTLFAVRLCEPDVVYLAPVLNPAQDVREFLALRVVQAQLVDASRPAPCGPFFLRHGAAFGPTWIACRTCGGRRPGRIFLPPAADAGPDDPTVLRRAAWAPVERHCLARADRPPVSGECVGLGTLAADGWPRG